MEARMCLEFSNGLADISILSRARGEGKKLLISANPCLNSKHILASMIHFLDITNWDRNKFSKLMKSSPEKCSL